MNSARAAAKRYRKVENATAVIWKTRLIAERTFRRLDAPERLAEVAEGVTYVNGARVKPSQTTAEKKAAAYARSFCYAQPMSHHAVARSGAQTSAQAWLTAEEESNRRNAMRAIIGSSLGRLVTSGLELLVVTRSGSVTLLSDARHNLGDVLTTVGVSVGFRVSRHPATARCPYGFGRAEDLAGIVMVAAIWGSAVLAGVES